MLACRPMVDTSLTLAVGALCLMAFLLVALLLAVLFLVVQMAKPRPVRFINLGGGRVAVVDAQRHETGAAAPTAAPREPEDDGSGLLINGRTGAMSDIPAHLRRGAATDPDDDVTVLGDKMWRDVPGAPHS